MRFDTEIYLITYTYVKNSKGDPIKTPAKRQTFAEEKSIRQSEHYQAGANGLKLEKTFIIWILEYNQESELEHEGITYSIERTFKKDRKEMELICTGLVGTRGEEDDG